MKNLIQSIFILIAVLLSTTGAEEVIYAQVGDTVNLNPPTIDGKNVYVKWSFRKENDLLLAWKNPLGGNSKLTNLPEEWKEKLTYINNALVVTKIQQENFGTFICKVTKDGTTPITTTTYKVVKIKVSLNPASPVLSGEPMTLTCNVPGQGIKIHWLDPQGIKQGDQGALTVNASYGHNGQWTCVMTNNGKESEAKISVKVIGLSEALPHFQYTPKSSPVTIPCSLLPLDNIKTKGIERVQWHFSPKSSSSQQTLLDFSLKDMMNWTGDKEKKLIPAPNLNDGNLSLIKQQATEEDEGNYTCSLKFKIGTLKRTTRVEVLEIISLGTEFISGQQVNLTCSTGYPLPSNIQLKWIPPKSSSQQISDPHPAHLNIPEVRKEDSGRWRCELWHKTTRLTSATIMLKIEPILSVWMLVTICGATVIVILICILVLILHQRRKRKMRHLRHRVCRCKNPKPKGFYRS